MADQNETEHLTGTEAKGGTELGVMRYVLGISLVLVIVLSFSSSGGRLVKLT